MVEYKNIATRVAVAAASLISTPVVTQGSVEAQTLTPTPVVTQTAETRTSTPTPVVTQEKVISETVITTPIPVSGLDNPCTQGDDNISGTVDAMTRQRQILDGTGRMHSTYHDSITGQLADQLGRKYQLSATDASIARDPDGSVTATGNFNLIGEGPIPDFHLRARFMQRNGVTTKDQVVAVCTGDGVQEISFPRLSDVSLSASYRDRAPRGITL